VSPQERGCPPLAPQARWSSDRSRPRRGMAMKAWSTAGDPAKLGRGDRARSSIHRCARSGRSCSWHRALLCRPTRGERDPREPSTDPSDRLLAVGWTSARLRRRSRCRTPRDGTRRVPAKGGRSAGRPPHPRGRGSSRCLSPGRSGPSPTSKPRSRPPARAGRAPKVIGRSMCMRPPRSRGRRPHPDPSPCPRWTHRTPTYSH
jgi:hypothetical protein